MTAKRFVPLALAAALAVAAVAPVLAQDSTQDSTTTGTMTKKQAKRARKAERKMEKRDRQMGQNMNRMGQQGMSGGMGMSNMNTGFNYPVSNTVQAQADIAKANDTLSQMSAWFDRNVAAYYNRQGGGTTPAAPSGQ